MTKPNSRFGAVLSNISGHKRTAIKIAESDLSPVERERESLEAIQFGKRGRRFKTTIISDWGGVTEKFLEAESGSEVGPHLFGLVERFSHFYGMVDSNCLAKPDSRPYFKFSFAGHLQRRIRVAIGEWNMHTPSAIVNSRGVFGKERACDDLQVSSMFSSCTTVGTCDHPFQPIPASWPSELNWKSTLLVVVALGKSVHVGSSFVRSPFRVVWLNEPAIGTAVVHRGPRTSIQNLKWAFRLMADSNAVDLLEPGWENYFIDAFRE